MANQHRELKGMSDERQIGRFYLQTKSPDKNLLCVMQKLLDHPILSGDFLYIRQKILFMLPW